MILDDYKLLTTQALVDLLAQETAKFTQLMAEKEFSPEYQEAKGTIKFIQGLIQSRQEIAITDGA